MKNLSNKFFKNLILMRIRLVPTLDPIARDIFNVDSLVKSQVKR